MSSFNRRTALLSLTALAACGFSPLYAPGGSAANLRGAVLVTEPTTEDTFRLVEELEERLGQPQDPRYVLEHSLTIGVAAGGRLQNSTLTRYTLRGTLNYNLVKANETALILARGETPEEYMARETVAQGTVTGFTNYSSGTLAYANTAAAAADARRRLTVILADKLVTQLELLDL